MRKRARERFGTGEEGEEDGRHGSHEERPVEPEVGGAEGGHINFFADIEKGVRGAVCGHCRDVQK